LIKAFFYFLTFIFSFLLATIGVNRKLSIEKISISSFSFKKSLKIVLSFVCKNFFVYVEI